MGGAWQNHAQGGNEAVYITVLMQSWDIEINVAILNIAPNNLQDILQPVYHMKSDICAVSTAEVNFTWHNIPLYTQSLPDCGRPLYHRSVIAGGERLQKYFCNKMQNNIF